MTPPPAKKNTQTNGQSTRTRTRNHRRKEQNQSRHRAGKDHRSRSRSAVRLHRRRRASPPKTRNTTWPGSDSQKTTPEGSHHRHGRWRRSPQRTTKHPRWTKSNSKSRKRKGKGPPGQPEKNQQRKKDIRNTRTRHIQPHRRRCHCGGIFSIILI